MMQWSPDTNHNAWYLYNEKQIDGFSLTHISGAGCALYGDFGVLPTTAAYAITMPPPEQEGARAYTGKSVPEVALWAAEHI
jgi:putative alpha-1,2-mannosidase